MSETTSSPPAEAVQDSQEPEKKSRRRRGGRGNTPPEQVSNAEAASATRARVSGGSNRTEITVTAFDFLGGSYALTTRARRIALVVMLLLGVALGYLVVSTMSTLSAASSAEAEAEQWKQRESQVLASFGEATGINVDQRLAIERQQDLEESLVLIAAGQFDLPATISSVNSVVVPGARPVDFKLGFLAVSGKDATSLDPAKGAPLEVLASAQGYLEGVEWAAGISALPGLYDAQAFPNGAEAVQISAFVPLGVPPSVLIDRLASQGIVYEAPAEPVQASAPTPPKKDAAASAEGEEGK